MRRFSRHLSTEKSGPWGWRVWMFMWCIASFLLLLAVWLLNEVIQNPSMGWMLLAIASLCWWQWARESRRLAKLRATRQDTICDFRKSFNWREVDPWILRATWLQTGRWIDSKRGFPVRAADDLFKDFKFIGEDVDDLVNDIAESAGYAMTDLERNPLFGKVCTVREVVLFLSQQPKIRAD